MKENRLAKEASPYLRQHAKNPVNWFPWGNEAFDKAHRENKPILLSIGYSTCHWCHVMERESFESDAIAEILNEHFVAIKLDREERPDIDKVYMTAYQMMTGENGGWPLNVFLTPKLEPFYGGTYFPPENRGGRVGFDSVLEQLHEAWTEKHGKVVDSAAALKQHILEQSAGNSAGSEIPESITLDRAAIMLMENADTLEGGWGAGPKFPMPSHLSFLLRAWQCSEDERLLNFVEMTAEKMANGGIRDQLSGAFHRYAVDGKWLVPHFEIMLYDQAQLLDVYLDLYQVTRKACHAQIAQEICDFTIAQMQTSQGAFHCAEDAQSEGKEGKFFCWTTQELRELLSAEEFATASSYFGLTDKGNFYDHSDPEALENQNVLSVVKDEQWLNASPERTAHVESSITKMKQARGQRVRPASDEKVLASWNGMMIGAMERAAVVLGKQEYAKAAERAHQFIVETLWDGKKLAHRWHHSGIDHSAQAESYLLFLQATRRRYELTLDPKLLELAVHLAESSIKEFYDPDHGGFFESAVSDDVIVRLKGDYDGAMPTASSIAVMEFLKLAEITGRNDFAEVANMTFKAHAESLSQTPSSLTGMLAALDFYHSKKQRLVVTNGSNGIEHFSAAIHNGYRPHLTVMGNQGPVASFESGLKSQNDSPTAYLCEGESCSPPSNLPQNLFA